MEILLKPRFIRQLNALEKRLQDEALEKIELFKNRENHPTLRVHKLHGHFKDCLSFSVNYHYRIVFEWLPNDTAGLISIGTHEIYDE